jgi:NADH/NAD ratio-sensing transcriptional regulator Rex
VADRAVAAGAKGILNFAAVTLRAPEHVPVTNVNLVMELEALSFAVTQAGKGE